VGDEETGKPEVMSITESFPEKGETYLCGEEHRMPDGRCGREGRVKVPVGRGMCLQRNRELPECAVTGELPGKEEE
jgi:hypothetical protein